MKFAAPPADSTAAGVPMTVASDPLMSSSAPAQATSLEFREFPAAPPTDLEIAESISVDSHLPGGHDENALLLSDAEAAPSASPSAASSRPSAPAANAPQPSLCSMAYYQRFFNVDTSDVMWRLSCVLIPTDGLFLEKIQSNIDLYGPFWVSASLVFLTGVTANLANYIDSQTAIWQYDFTRMTFASLLIFLYLLIVPLLLWIALIYHSINAKLVEVICAYGYAFFPFLFACVLCIFPFEIVRWIAVCVACLLSTTFVVQTTSLFWKKMPPGRLFWFLSAMIVCHLGLSMAFKFFFFDFAS